MILNCMIVDDEPLARKVISEYIEDIEYLELKGIAENPVKADTLLNSGEIDLLFLDVNMPRLSGIEFLRTLSAPPMTIITTAYAEYAIDGFELQVLDYLVKPISFERFLKAANKARDHHQLLHPELQINSFDDQHFFVKCDGRIEKIHYDELIYVESMLNYVVLHLENRKLIVYLTMKGIASQLPTSRFLKVHKSYLVNLSRIKSIDSNEIRLGQASIPISQNLYESVLREIVKDKMIRR